MNVTTQKKLLALVSQNYETIASDFDKTRKKPLWPPLVELLAPIKSGSILDVGCGNGRILKLFTDTAVAYTGVDNSKNLLALAQQNYPATNAKFILGDILALDKLPLGNFDHIISIAVLHHLPGQNLQIKALEQLKNKLNPNGRIIVTVWNLWDNKKYRSLILKFALQKILGRHRMDWGDIVWVGFSKNNLASQRYYHAFTKRRLKKIAAQAGLKIEKISKDKYNYYLVLKK